MSKQTNDDDYLNLRQSKQVDEFALGENSSDLTEEKTSMPHFFYIAPIIVGFIILVGLALSIFVMRAWDQTPLPDIDTKSIRVIEPNVIKGNEKNSKINNSSAPASNLPITPTVENPRLDTSNLGLQPVNSILSEVMPAIGMVLVKTSNKVNSGSGFIIRNDGLFVTNYHVIEDAQEIAIKLNNREKVNFAEILTFDIKKDLAILKLREIEKYPTLRLEENFIPNLGDDLLVLGYPLGIKLGLEVTISTGIISSIRALPEVNLIQTNAAINHGNSGGPVISRRTGKVIGIVTAKARDSESIGFAINVKELQLLIDK
ncbi:MAG: serine protease [Acidobacteria bacterium]|nr:serine protease [Acidobacteriota bacterium]